MKLFEILSTEKSREDGLCSKNGVPISLLMQLGQTHMASILHNRTEKPFFDRKTWFICRETWFFADKLGFSLINFFFSNLIVIVFDKPCLSTEKPGLSKTMTIKFEKPGFSIKKPSLSVKTQVYRRKTRFLSR